MSSLKIIIPATLTPLVAYLIRFGVDVSDDHQRWGEFGSYLSGVYGSLAIIGLIYTTKITQSQILKQSEDTIFYKLFDLLQNKILQLSINSENSVSQGHQALKIIANNFCKEITTQSQVLGYDLFRFHPEELQKSHIQDVFLAKFSDYDRSITNMNEYLAKVIAKIPNERNEYYQFFFNHLENESEEVKIAFSKIGQFYFYKVEFSRRKPYYVLAAEEINKKYGGFLDSYVSTLTAMLLFSSKSERSEDFITFLKSQLTNHEMIVLFYFILGLEVKFEHLELIKNSHLLEKLYEINAQILMFDTPSASEIAKEMSNLFSHT